MKWETTTILLEQLRDSEPIAWQRFSERFRPPMLGFASKFGLSEALAEDAVQEALIKFVEGYRSGQYDRERGRLGTWLFTLLYHSIRSQRRDNARSPIQGPRSNARTTFFSAIPDQHEAQQDWELDWERHTLSTCMSQLRGEMSPTHFRAFELTSLQQVPAAEVADQLNMSREAVYQARYRVLKRLEELRVTFEGIEESAT